MGKLKKLKKPAKPLKNFHTVTPFLMVKNADLLVEFMKNAFDAQVKYDLHHDNGTLWHAQIKIGNSILMVGDAGDDHTSLPAALYLSVPNPEDLYMQAVCSGGKSVMEPRAPVGGGGTTAGIRDPFGNIWWFAQNFEEFSYNEMTRCAKKALIEQPLSAGRA